MKKSGQPTMKDVAREAGVSLGTVSKVINEIPVGETYKNRVESAIRKLGYRVNNYARGLKTNKTNCVALLMPSLTHPFFAYLTDALTESLMRHDYRAILMITNYDPEAETKCLLLGQQNKVDGVIALTYHPNLDEIDDSIPIVTIDRHFPGRIPCVSSDNFRGGELAAEKLVELGCKKLLYLGTGPEILGEADKRGPGFENACRKAGVGYDRISLHGGDSDTAIFDLIRERIKNGAFDFDGIFCKADWLARKVLNLLQEYGIQVPEEVQIIGYDGIIDYATGLYPCSTIVQPLAMMAEAAVNLVLHADEDLAPVNLCLPVTYVSAGTTKDSL
ncbi:MAG: LacI family DNA-binding transcriptional regulator [Oscillospiraceae bacterium]|nr:LacI family DNA-binding transcriptional regulator [Oscillospiraceae bacterium]